MRADLKYNQKLRAHALGELQLRLVKSWPKKWQKVQLTRKTSVRALHAMLLLVERGTKPQYVQDVRRLPGVGPKTAWELVGLLKLEWKP